MLGSRGHCIAGLPSQHPEDWMAVGLRGEGFIGCPWFSIKKAPGERFLVEIAFEHWAALFWVVFLLHRKVFGMTPPAQCDLPCYSGIFDPISLSVGRHQPSTFVDLHDGHRSRVEPSTEPTLNGENEVFPGW